MRRDIFRWFSCCALGASSVACGDSEPGTGGATAGVPGVNATAGAPAGQGGSNVIDSTPGGTTATGGTATVPAGGGGAMNASGATSTGGVTSTGGTMSTGGTAQTGGASMGGTTSTGGAAAGTDPNPSFSFFVTSQQGLEDLAAELGRTDPAGFGGDFRVPLAGGGMSTGLDGADMICTMLARRGSVGDSKVWRAFLSSTGTVDGDGQPINAIDRIGPGPWYNLNDLLFANDIAGLMQDGDGRPVDASEVLAVEFTDENGDLARLGQDIDNHDTVTGSQEDGTLSADGTGATCMDWTSDTLVADGQVAIGHSWPRVGLDPNDSNGNRWILEHTVNGCEPGGIITGNGGPAEGDNRIGAGGGYGGFYCFALGAVAP